MSERVQEIPKGYVLPIIGIFYSSNKSKSFESEALAHYLAGLLFYTGYARVRLIPFDSEDNFPQPGVENFSVYINNKIIQVPKSHVTFGNWSTIEECDVFITTINPRDCKPFAERLSFAASATIKKIPLFSLQRGVNYSSIVGQLVESHGITHLDGAVGFSCIYSKRLRAYCPLISKPSLAFHRLSNEELAIGDGPLRLFEHMPINVYFRKNLNTVTWGVVVFELLYALNALAKNSISDTLKDPLIREMYSTLIFEANEVFIKVARGKGWKLDLQLISNTISVTALQYILVLPTFINKLVFSYAGIWPSDSTLISSVQDDFLNDRQSPIVQVLDELIDIARVENVHIPLLKSLQSLLHSIDGSPITLPEDELNENNKKVSSVSTISYKHTDNFINLLTTTYKHEYPYNMTRSLLYYYLPRLFLILSIIALVVFIFFD